MTVKLLHSAPTSTTTTRLKAFRRSTLAGGRFFVAVNHQGAAGWPWLHREPARVEARIRALAGHQRWTVEVCAPRPYARANVRGLP